MANDLIRLAAVVLLVLSGAPARAVTIYRDYQIDLDELSYGMQDDGITRTAYLYLPVDPFVSQQRVAGW